jgi:Ca-activated chloride channel family protein
MFSSRYENERPDGIAVLEVWNPEEPSPEQPRRFVPLRRTELRGQIVGPLANLRVSHVYEYTRDQCPEALEVLYRFPLPGDAAVTGVRVQFGDVEIHTELKERPEAEAEYDAARSEGRQAALLTRESADVFTLRVAGIRPDEPVRVETTYVELARAEGAGWSLRIPLTTAPRYVREDELGSRPSQGQPLALLRDPGHRFTLDLEIAGAGSVTSPTHTLALTSSQDRVRVSLQEGETLPDRDCVLSWQPEQEASRPTFRVWLHDDRKAGEVYFLALVAPPAVPSPDAGVAREIVLLVDHSGSMEGAKWAAADWAAKRFFSDLTDRDAFALGLFHNDTRWFAQTLRPADASTVAEAIRFLESHRDSGGTNLGVALEQALRLPRTPGDRARHVLVLTDAEVTDEGRILRLVDEERSRPNRRRVSDICIDAPPNSYLALELAERGGGIARFLTSDPSAEDITTALDEILADWAQPVLIGLQLAVDRPGAEATGRDVRAEGEEESLVDLGDLPTGRACWVIGRAPRAASTAMGFRVLMAEGREIKARGFDLEREEHPLPALKALFGARRLLALEHLRNSGYEGEEMAQRLRRLGYDPETVFAAEPGQPPSVYAENARQRYEDAFKRLLVSESLAYGLLSSETAFVAVRTERGEPVKETVVVANALPAGWSERFLDARFGGLGFGGPSRLAVRRLAMSAMFPATSAAAPDAFMLAGAEAMPADAAPSGAGLLDRLRARQSKRASRGQIPGAKHQAPSTAPTRSQLFEGTPAFTGGEALLFDSARDEDRAKLPEEVTLSLLRVRFPSGAPEPGGGPPPATLDPGLCLLLYVGDLSTPRARVRLADLVRLGGERPLNLVRQPGERVRLVLVDPAGTWADGAPKLEVEIG